MLRAQRKPPREVVRSPREAPIVVGKIAGPYGIKGWLKVVSFTDPRDNLLGYRPWRLARGGQIDAVEVEAARPHGRVYVVKIKGIDDRRSAEALADAEIAIDASALPRLPDNEFYWRDLLGMAVVLPDGALLGRVVELIETSANDVLVVESDTGRRLIPFVAAVIGDVDLAARTLVADWREPAEA
jgi:16S rRNA processing protein RimM